MSTLRKSFFSNFFFALMFLSITTQSYGAPVFSTYSAKILKPDGTALEANRVDFKFTIMNPSANCSLFSEMFTSVDMQNSGGNVSLTLGNGTRSYPTSGTMKFIDVFENLKTYDCEQGSTFSSLADSSRKVVMQFNDGSGWQTLIPMQVNSVPYAGYAIKAQSATSATIATTATNSMLFNGKADTDFVARPLTCGTNQVLSFNGSDFSCVNAASGAGSVDSVSSDSYFTITSATTTPRISANIGVSSGTLAAGNDSRLVGAAQKSNNLSDLTSMATARTNLGLGALAVKSQVDLSTGDVTGIVGVANLSGANLISALGYTPANSATVVSSQWAQSGATINYMGGNVGVGSATPTVKLAVSGTIVSQANSIPTGGAVNLALSNTHILQSVGGSTITLSNMVNGGVYTLIFQDQTARTYTFSGCGTTRFSPANAATTASTDTMFGITTVQVGATWYCYITWASGFQ